MPIYEYLCPSCDNQFELLVRASDKPACPTCGSSKIEKQLSVPAAHTAASKSSLPIAQTGGGGCGMPQCGGGHCGFGG